MAASASSSSSSSSRTTQVYEVFLSFRGVDTRCGFISFLHAALLQEKIETFIDDRLEQGDEISPALLSAIKNFIISVIVFSKRYANSRCCLDELVKIFKCKEKYSQNVIPVFYHVEPSHVRHQTGTFGDGFIELEEHFKDRLEMVERWRNTLSKAADLCGFDSKNIREESKKLNGLNSMLENLCKILKIRKDDLNSSLIKQKLEHTNILIVFDDVSSIEQINTLIGDLINFFGSRSQIIITTRDKHVVEGYKVLIKDRNISLDIYKVEKLLNEDALELFSWHAFGKNCPSSDFLSLSKSVVEYAKDVPLALKELGQFLCGRSEEEWESAIKKLQKFPHREIHEMLKLSYDELDYSEQNIFLDMACFLRRENRDFVQKLLDSSGFETEIGIKVLIDKCLITISDNKIIMNDLIRRMGWEIVRCESPKNPEDRSRLCDHVDIRNVLNKNKGTDKIEGICLNMSKIAIDIHVRHNAFAKMSNLRLFKLHNSHCEENNYIKVKDFQCLESDVLRYLHWHRCPLNSLQSKFTIENLVALVMPHSNVEQLWNGDQQFPNLGHINLSHSKNLVKIRDFSFAPNLETLILEGCTKLLEISSYIESLKKLTYLGLGSCKSLQYLPMLPYSLKTIDANCCKSLESSSGLPVLSTTNSRSVRFNFSNCFELDQNALKDIIKDGVQKIEHPEARSCPTHACICFPGTKIPEWFNFQRTGSSITLKRPTGWFDKKFVRFALCAIVEFRNYHNQGQGLEVGHDCKNDTGVYHQGILRGWDYGTGPGCVNSDHIFMGCDFLSCDASKYRNDEITIEFFVKDLNGKDIDTCEVKGCGFYSLQFPEVGNEMEVTVDEEEEEKERHCKKLKCSNFFKG